MNQTRYLDKINSSKDTEINDRLDTSKICEGMRGARFYKDMDPQFLNNVLYMTATVNGLIMTSSSYKFLITVPSATKWDPLVSFELVFSRASGVCHGVFNLVFKDGYDMDFFDEAKATRQIKRGLNRFTILGRNLGLLIVQERVSSFNPANISKYFNSSINVNDIKISP